MRSAAARGACRIIARMGERPGQTPFTRITGRALSHQHAAVDGAGHPDVGPAGPTSGCRQSFGHRRPGSVRTDGRQLNGRCDGANAAAFLESPMSPASRRPLDLRGPAPLAAADLPQAVGYRLKMGLLGAPLTRDSLSHQRLSKVLALGVLASDCISSSAYGTEEMLIVLLPAMGVAGFTILLPLTAVILTVLLIVSLSYLDVVNVYTKTGGSYVVARENFGPMVAQIAAVALMLDYIVTVAVQAAAGTLALSSAFPSLDRWQLEITVGVVMLLAYGNLRGIREAGKAFAFPTYMFAGSMGLLLIGGAVRAVFGDLPHYAVGAAGTSPVVDQQLVGWAFVFVLLRAFANGGSSLTGLEAISNGVSVFHEPEGRNARKTLVAMSLILGTLVAGVSLLAHVTHAAPHDSGTPTVIAQVAQAVFGTSPLGHGLFLLVQFSTMLILWTGANTPFSGFPFLASFVAEDQFLPRQLMKRGHRLAFSNGIIVLTAAATALLIGTGAHVDKLVAFYAIGVFTGFTLAGFGMAKHFSRERTGPWRRKMIVNAVSGSVSMVVVLVFAVVKFTEGAWLVVVIFPIAVAALIRLNRQYRREAAALEVISHRGAAPIRNISRSDIIVLVDGLDLASITAARYARSLRPASLRAVHFVLDDAYAETLRAAWSGQKVLQDIPLHLIDCPDRRLERAICELAVRETLDPGSELTLLMPRRTYPRVLGRLLHDHTADDIARATSRLPRVVTTAVPFDVAGLIERRARADSARKLAAVGRSGLGSDAAGLPDGLAGESADPAPDPVGGASGAPSAAADRPDPRGPGLLVAIGSRKAPEPTPIGGLGWRQRAAVQGTVRSVRMAPMSGSPSVEIELWDDTGGITLVFYGRRSVTGVMAGSRLAAEGMVGERSGRLAICNPLYRLLDGDQQS
jgi:amino acid transporter